MPLNLVSGAIFLKYIGLTTLFLLQIKELS